VKGMLKMKKVKILTIILAIILVTLIAFGGIYVQTQNRMENKVKDYELGRELKSQRVIELKIKESTSTDSENSSSDENTETDSSKETENSEETTSTENESTENKLTENKLTEKDYENAKKIMEKRLQALGAQDYTISLDKENGTVRVELAENDNVDMYIYYLYASQKITIKDTDSKDILLNDEMIKGAKYSYTSDSKGAYQVYEEIELTKDGQAKLNELLNDYALLATDVTEIENAKKASESESTKTESTSEENTESTENTDEQNTESTETQSTTEETSSNSETTKKTAKLYVNDTTYDVSKIEKGKITVKIGSSSTNTTSVNNNISKAAEIAMLENAGKLPADYEVDTNRYEYSSITQKEIIYFAIVMIAILVITLLVYCVIYKKSGILASISFVGFVASFSLLIRYTNVAISIEGISAIIIVMIINLIINREILSKTKKMNLVNEAVKATYKNVYLKLIPVGISTIVFCLAKWESLSSFGMIMFWGLVLTAIYNATITRTLLNLKENK
jgi:membrane protein